MPITEDAGLGAAITPEEWATYVLDHLAAASVLLASGATELRTIAKQLHVPRVTGDSTTGWYDELEPIGEGAPPGDEAVLDAAQGRDAREPLQRGRQRLHAAVLDTVGTAMTRSVAREADRAMFAGTGGKQPTGLLNIAPALPSHVGAVDYAGHRHRERARTAQRAARRTSLRQPRRSTTRLQLVTEQPPTGR